MYIDSLYIVYSRKGCAKNRHFRNNVQMVEWSLKQIIVI